MTSSLVGSEMCIRDRTSTPSCGAWEAPHLGLSIGSSDRRLQSNHGSTHPVSYTHLTLPTICSV
eukprot:9965283-Prorocentrum_lima.AAC.1